MEVSTDEGIAGIGETIGAAPTLIINKNIKPEILGGDPFDIEHLFMRSLWTTGWTGINVPNMVPVAAVEMALWDIIGKALKRPLCDLIGGRFREEADLCPPIMAAYEGEKDLSVEGVVELASATVRRHGFRTIQLYGAVFPPWEDIRTVKMLRETLGPDVNIRVDVNTAWSPETAIRTLQKMKKHDLADVEDATQSLEAMARVRRSVNIPFSTHYTDIATILRLGSADTVVGDLHDSGGISGVKKLIAQTEGFNLGFWFHSSNELGISVAAMLHLIASTPHIIHPSQTMQIYLTDDIIQQSFEFQNGALSVPTKPGLGVTIDRQKLEKYSKLYDEIGEYKFFGFDPRKPKWFPRIPAW